jgi:tetratricopeptide (TPR) repeat protein
MKYNKEFYDKYGIKVTDEAVITHNDETLSAAVDRFYYALTKGDAVSPALIADLEMHVARYPDIPAFKNHLYAVYLHSKKYEKAKVLLHKTIEQHPDYAFAHINLANQFIQEKNFTKAASILKEPYDVRTVEQGEFIHRSVFYNYYTAAFRIEIGRKNLEEAARIHCILFDYDAKDKDMKQLARLLLSERLKVGLSGEPKNDRVVVSVSKPIKSSFIADMQGKPLFNHTELHQLYTYGLDTMPKKVIQQILALPRATLIQDLEHVFMDSILRYDYFASHDWDDNRNHFFIHALYFLTELKAYESLDTILDFLRQDEDFTDFWIGGCMEEHLHPTLYLLGFNQLEVLKKFVLEENINGWHRLLACHVTAQVAMKHPARREEVVIWFRDIMRYHLANASNNGLIDSDFLSGLIVEVVHLRCSELEDDIKALFKKGWIDASFGGDLEVVLKELHVNFNPIYDDPLPLGINELYSGAYQKRKNLSNDPNESNKLAILNDPHSNFLIDIMSEFIAKNNTEDDDDYDYEPQQPVKRTEPKVGRNDPCPCGSGKKYKKCHGD